MKIGSLFSGIGGIELGFHRAGHETIWFIEKEAYARKVLEKNFPGVKIYNDIRKIAWKDMERPDILTGGFPCQDISIAGKGKGIREGERSGLWTHYAEAIGVLRPSFALIENVPAITHRGLDVVLADLAQRGYDAQWFTLSARQLGALHRRERLFILAYPDQERHRGRSDEEAQREEHDAEVQGRGVQADPAHTDKVRHLQGRPHGQGVQRREQACSQDRQCITPYDLHRGIQRVRQKEIQEQRGLSWCKDVRRVEDLQERPDIPQPLLRGSRNGVPHYVDRIACLGNAVVPQVAEAIAYALDGAIRR